MSLVVLKSRAQLGIEAPLVSIEVHLSNGLPGFINSRIARDGCQRK